LKPGEKRDSKLRCVVTW